MSECLGQMLWILEDGGSIITWFYVCTYYTCFISYNDKIMYIQILQTDLLRLEPLSTRLMGVL